MRISDCRASSILKAVPVSEDVQRKCFVQARKKSCTKILKPAFENFLGIYANKHQMLREGLDNMFVDHPGLINHVTISVSELEYFWCRNYENFTLCPGSTVDPTSSPKQCLKSLEFSKQLSDVFTQIRGDISRKLYVNFRLPGI